MGEEDRLLQACRDAQHEAEEEACHACTQGCEPIHQGAMCLQGKAGLEDREGPGYEEAQGGHQLSHLGRGSSEVSTSWEPQAGPSTSPGVRTHRAPMLQSLV